MKPARPGLLMFALVFFLVESPANPSQGGDHRSAAELARAYEMQKAVCGQVDYDKVEALLRSGFDPKQSIGCGTYCGLNGAIDQKDPRLASLFLKYGARPDESMVVDAAFINNEDASLDILKQFFAVGADVNSRQLYNHDRKMSWRPLGQAVYRGHLEVVKLLLGKKGVEVNYVDGDGYTPLMIAAEKGEQDIVKLLLAAGADPAISTPERGTASGLSKASVENQQSIQHLLQGGK